MIEDYRTSLEIIEAYLDAGQEEDYIDFIAGRTDLVMEVDWREHDEDIIQYCEDILKTKQLSAICVDADNAQGFELTIQFQSKQLKVDYRDDGADRDTTIIYLNQILQPEYEIRFCQASHGADTLAFLPLSQKSWRYLERQWGSQLDEYFVKIEADSCFFG